MLLEVVFRVALESCHKFDRLRQFSITTPFFRVEGCSLTLTGTHISLFIHHFTRVFLLYFTASSISFTSPRFRCYRMTCRVCIAGVRPIYQLGLSSYIVLCVLCPVLVYMCNVLGVGGSTVMYILSRLPYIVLSVTFQ